jgi:DNA-directed RNA polymerase subunit RPC12/RpoP
MKTYRTAAGSVKFIEMTETEYGNSEAEYGGLCLTCGAQAEGVEPDARHYECESCGAKRVFGMEELLVMGLVKIV